MPFFSSSLTLLELYPLRKITNNDTGDGVFSLEELPTPLGGIFVRFFGFLFLVKDNDCKTARVPTVKK